MAIHERFHHLEPRLGCGSVAQLPGFGRREAHRLFAEHVLAGFHRPNRPRDVLIVRERYVNRIDLGIRQQRCIGIVKSRNPEPAGRTLGLVARARSDGHHFGQLPALHGGNDFFDADLGGAQNAKADLVHAC